MNARTHLGMLAAIVAVVMLGSAVPSHAGEARFDLDGTWTGTIKCKSFNGGAKDKFTLTPTMRIAQGGLEVGLVLDYGGGDTEQYSGVANPDAKKPFDKGELAIVFCGTNDRVGDPPTFDEIGRITVKAKQGQVKASFKGTSIFSDPGTGLDTEAGTCKWSYKRTSNDPPMLPTSCLAGLTLP